MEIHNSPSATFDAQGLLATAAARPSWDVSAFGTVVEHDETIVYANGAYATLLGYPGAEALLGMPISTVVARTDRKRLSAYARKRISGCAAPKAYEFRASRLDGDSLPVQIRVDTWQLHGRPFIRSTVVRVAERPHAILTDQEFEALYRSCAPVIVAAVRRILGSDSEADECVNDAFLQAWRTADTFDPARGAALSWLMSIARSRALDTVRRRKLTAKYSDGISWSCESAVDARELGPDVTRIQALLTKLPSAQRDVVKLSYFDGLSHSEIAELTHQPLGTIKTRLQLALRKLRAGLGVPVTT